MIEKTSVPTYKSAVDFVLAKGGARAANKPIEGGEGDGVWSCVSNCIREWQIADEEFSFLDELACHLSTEKNLLIILAGESVASADLLRCQQWLLSGEGQQSKWMLPLLTSHLVQLIENGNLDVKQWMLDMFEEGSTAKPMSLALFAGVMISLMPTKLCAATAMWISDGFCLTMLPYSVPSMLRSLPSAFGKLWAHRFLATIRSARKIDQRLISTLISIKDYFSSEDAEAFDSVLAMM